MGYGDEIDTLVIMAMREKGLTEEYLRREFEEIPGFVMMKVNPKGGMAFAKFEDRAYAEAAMSAANEMQLGAEWARRNLEVEGAPEEERVPRDIPEGDWVCPRCNDVQFAKRMACRRCSTPKPGPANRWAPAASKPAYRQSEQDSGAIDTICILAMDTKGLTEDYIREEFGQLPGFVMAKVNPRMSAAFAKFKSRTYAQAALQAANELGLGAEWAKRNLDPISPTDGRDERIDGPPPAKRARTEDYSYGGGYSRDYHDRDYGDQYPLSNRSNGQIDTITILGMTEKGLTEDYLRQEFPELPGYVMMKCNPRKGIAFAKFATRRHAEAALKAANTMGLGAEWANRNLEVEDPAKEDWKPAYSQPPARSASSLPALRDRSRGGYGDYLQQDNHSSVPPGDWVCPKCNDVQFAKRLACRSCGAAKPSRGAIAPWPVRDPSAEYKAKAAEEGGPIHTLAIMAMAEKNLTEEYLRDEFGQMPGFVMMKVNPRMGCAFAKFETREDAESAMDASNSMNLGAEWAKRNLTQ